MGGKVRVNPVGKKFGSVTVIEELERVKNMRTYKTRCECGKVRILNHSNLHKEKKLSCRCESPKALAFRLDLQALEHVDPKQGVRIFQEEYGYSYEKALEKYIDWRVKYVFG